MGDGRWECGGCGGVGSVGGEKLKAYSLYPLPFPPSPLKPKDREILLADRIIRRGLYRRVCRPYRQFQSGDCAR